MDMKELSKGPSHQGRQHFHRDPQSPDKAARTHSESRTGLEPVRGAGLGPLTWREWFGPRPRIHACSEIPTEKGEFCGINRSASTSASTSSAGGAALLILAHEHARDAHWRFKGHLCNYELIGYLSKHERFNARGSSH